MLFYLIRHGDPIYNPDSLTPLGKRQAEAVGRRLAVNGMDEIYSSPMIRAQETAKPLAELLNKEVKIEDWTYECWDEFSIINEKGNRMFCMQLPGEKFVGNDNFYLRDDEWLDMECLKGSKAKEGWARITKAADEFFARHGYVREGRAYRITEPNEKRIALFCHAGFASILLPYLLNIPPHIYWSSLDVSHTGVCILRFRNTESGITVPKCLVHSDLSHIYADNLPMRYNNYDKL